MSNNIFKADNQSVKFKALNNMLAGSASAHAVKHFRREMGGLFSDGIHRVIPEHFIKTSLQAGRTVVLFNATSWIITSGGPHDVDFLVLRSDGDGGINYFAMRTNAMEYHHSGIVEVDESATFRSMLAEIINDYSGYGGVGSLERNYQAIAVSEDLIYTPPDWEVTLHTLPENWTLVKPNSVAQGNKTSTTVSNNSTNQENKTMSNVKNTATVVAAKNKSAVVAVAKLEAGRIAIKQVSRVVTPKLPMMIRGYADSEIGRLVMANLFNFAVTQFAANNQNAQLVADAMLEGAMLEMLQKFNFEEMINEVVNKVDISKLTSSEE